MKELIYISPLDIDGINAVHDLGNEAPFLEYLDYVDYHFVFFSTLFQSGVNYFETDLDKLPNDLVNNPFWKDKFQQIDTKLYNDSFIKAGVILKDNFDLEKDKAFRAPQFQNVINHFTSLFYSLDSSTPFISTQFISAKDFEFLNTRFSKELYTALTNLYSLISSESIQTVIPQYSVLKKDLKRFEDISTSSIFRNYSETLRLLPMESNSKSLTKDIKKKAIKVYSKHASSLDMKSMTFSFIKSNKKILDLFTNKLTSIMGDFIIESVEKVVSNKRMIHFYDFKDAYILRLFAERIGDLQRTGGKEAFDKVLNEIKKAHNNACKSYRRTL